MAFLLSKYMRTPGHSGLLMLLTDRGLLWLFLRTLDRMVDPNESFLS